MVKELLSQKFTYFYKSLKCVYILKSLNREFCFTGQDSISCFIVNGENLFNDTSVEIGLKTTAFIKLVGNFFLNSTKKSLITNKKKFLNSDLSYSSYNKKNCFIIMNKSFNINAMNTKNDNNNNSTNKETIKLNKDFNKLGLYTLSKNRNSTIMNSLYVEEVYYKRNSIQMEELHIVTRSEQKG